MLRRVTAPRPFPWQLKLISAIKGIDPETGEPFKVRPKYIIAGMGRRAGKSVACSLAAGMVASERRGAKVFWGAHTADGCTIGHSLFHGPLERQEHREREPWTMYGPAVVRKQAQPLQSELYGGSSVFWRSMEGKGAAIGRGWDLAIIDEFDRVKPDVIKRDVIPATADTGGPVVGITSPNYRGLGHEWYKKFLGGDPKYFGISGPSTENPNKFIQDFARDWKDELGEDDPLYKQEILGQWVDSRGAVFRNVEASASLAGWRDEPSPDGLYVLGADLGESRDYTVLVAMDALTGQVHGHWRGHRIGWPQQIQVIKEFCRRWGGPLYVDETGVGAPIVDELRGLGIALIAISIQSKIKHNLIVALRAAMSKGELSYPKDPVLMEELLDYGMNPLPGGSFRYSAPQGKHDDWVISLALANWGRLQGLAWNVPGLEYGPAA